MVGFDEESHMDPGMMPMMGSNDVGGTGTHNLKMWTQNCRSGRFQSVKNIDYDVSQLMGNLANTPMILFAGPNDAFSQPKDMEQLVALLPADQLQVETVADYNHLDYMWAEDCDTKVNDKLYQWMAQVEQA